MVTWLRAHAFECTLAAQALFVFWCVLCADPGAPNVAAPPAPCADQHRCVLQPCGPRGGGGACRSHHAAFCDVDSGVCVPCPSMAAAGSGRDSGWDGCFHPISAERRRECALSSGDAWGRRPAERATHPRRGFEPGYNWSVQLCFSEWRGSPFDFGCGPRFGNRACASAAEPYCNASSGYCGNTTALSCGNHMSYTGCAGCTRGNGASWCNGVCAWEPRNGTCQLTPAAERVDTYDHHRGGNLQAVWLRATGSHWSGLAWPCMAAWVAAYPALHSLLDSLGWEGNHHSRPVLVVGPAVTLLVVWCGWRNRLGGCHPYGSTLAVRPEHAGQLWRLWSYALVHKDDRHELTNVFAWVIVQLFPEFVYGPWAAALAVLVAAPQAAIWGLLLSPASSQVGLSGVVFGMSGFLAAPAVATWRAAPLKSGLWTSIWDAPETRAPRWVVAWMLLAAGFFPAYELITLLFETPAERSKQLSTTSWEGHLGGYVAGLAMAILASGPFAEAARPRGTAGALPGSRRARAWSRCRRAVLGVWRRAQPIDKLAAAVLLAPPLLLAARGMPVSEAGLIHCTGLAPGETHF